MLHRWIPESQWIEKIHRVLPLRITGSQFNQVEERTLLTLKRWRMRTKLKAPLSRIPWGWIRKWRKLWMETLRDWLIIQNRALYSRIRRQLTMPRMWIKHTSQIIKARWSQVRAGAAIGLPSAVPATPNLLFGPLEAKRRLAPGFKRKEAKQTHT